MFSLLMQFAMLFLVYGGVGLAFTKIAKAEIDVMDSVEVYQDNSPPPAALIGFTWPIWVWLWAFGKTDTLVMQKNKTVIAVEKAIKKRSDLRVSELISEGRTATEDYERVLGIGEYNSERQAAEAHEMKMEIARRQAAEAEIQAQARAEQTMMRETKRQIELKKVEIERDKHATDLGQQMLALVPKTVHESWPDYLKRASVELDRMVVGLKQIVAMRDENHVPDDLMCGCRSCVGKLHGEVRVLEEKNANLRKHVSETQYGKKTAGYYDAKLGRLVNEWTR